MQALIRALEEEVREREWDHRWDMTLATPESDAYLTKLEEELTQDITAGTTIKYIPGKSLDELFGMEEISPIIRHRIQAIYCQNA